ncbi:hypothetical protein [Aureimonas populi]|uniref:Uncharacterized protein n=1 Tax=Aureimonas populi TaxID=1701758 RepID=A0ABW5CMF3_9HYPH|nr:hypothetical protein [Aureimonas populi]
MQALRLSHFPAVLCLSACAFALPALAQQGGGGPGGGPRDGDDGPGVYASPSAIPDGNGERFGIPQSLRRTTLAPIALPEGTGNPLQAPSFPALPDFAVPMLPSPELLRSSEALVLRARLDEEGEDIPDGLVWRIFSQERNREGQLQLVGVFKGGEAAFDVPPGSYFLHVGYGRAGVTRKIEFSGRRTEETVVLDAGGLRLNASATAGSDEPIQSEKLTFDIYREETPGAGRSLVATGVPANVVVRLNSGTYQVVSNYGAVNAVVRADIRVEPNRITDALLQHRAAELTMKLVREEGGEAIADTAWSIASAQGDIVRESVGAFSSVILAEGDYLVVAKNRDRIYQRELRVEAGNNAEIEVLVSEAQPAVPGEGSGD